MALYIPVIVLCAFLLHVSCNVFIFTDIQVITVGISVDMLGMAFTLF